MQLSPSEIFFFPAQDVIQDYALHFVFMLVSFTLKQFPNLILFFMKLMFWKVRVNFFIDYSSIWFVWSCLIISFQVFHLLHKWCVLLSVLYQKAHAVTFPVNSDHLVKVVYTRFLYTTINAFLLEFKGNWRSKYPVPN